MMTNITILPYIIVPFDNFSYDFGQPSVNQKLMVIFLFGGVYGSPPMIFTQPTDAYGSPPMIFTGTYGEDLNNP